MFTGSTGDALIINPSPPTYKYQTPVNLSPLLLTHQYHNHHSPQQGVLFTHSPLILSPLSAPKRKTHKEERSDFQKKKNRDPFPMASASTTAAPPQLYFDEKWKLSKKEGSRRSRSTSRSSISHITKNSSRRSRCTFSRKCARLVNEQRARFYIMRRCVTMLICWRDYGDS